MQICKKWLLATSYVLYHLSICLHVCMGKNLISTILILMIFDIWVFFQKSAHKIQVSLKSDKNNRYFMWRTEYFYDNVSLNSS